jgi:hypothetical protein
VTPFRAEAPGWPPLAGLAALLLAALVGAIVVSRPDVSAGRDR